MSRLSQSRRPISTKIHSAKAAINLRLVVFITVTYIIAVLFVTLADYLLLKPFEQFVTFPHTTNLVINLVAAVIAGLAVGSFEVFYLKNRFRKRSFGQVLLIKSGFYIGAIFCITVVLTFFAQAITKQRHLFDPDVIAGVMAFFGGTGVWLVFLQWGFIIVFTLFLLQVNDMFGQGVLFNFLLGRYHRPREERRIFMFLDMKSSTSIAEKIGHIQYYELLNDFFFDLTDPIILSLGEVYQYVGDEIVVSWRWDNGVRDANCMECFFRCQDAIHAKASYYQGKYGVVPEFKAGIHSGKVAVGEVGVIKKEIVFTGDVLNASSRIHDTCKEYGEDLLVSREVLESLDMAGAGYNSEKIGVIDLRGRHEAISLFSVTRPDRH
ncbi:MAG: adenylate/guanylate cyclase domain-containing protein [Bacteroidota bacterium]